MGLAGQRVPEPKTRTGDSIRPWLVGKCEPGELRDGRRCAVAPLSQPPHVEVRHRLGEPGVVDCSQGIPTAGRSTTGRDSLQSPDKEGPICAGTQRDLFPSTTVYLIARVVDPHAKHYDPHQHAYVVGPVVSTVFYQLAGIRRAPDGAVAGGSGAVGGAGGSGAAGAFGSPHALLLGVSVGGDYPVAKMHDAYSPGFESRVDLEWPFTQHFRAGVELGYHAFAPTPAAPPGNLGVTDAALAVKVLGGSGLWRPFASAGVGLYRALGSTHGGYQAGVGLEVPVTARAALETGVTAHAVNGTGAGDLRFLDAWLGFELRVP